MNYLVSLLFGMAVGAAYALLRVTPPAPPLIALIGLLGMLTGESATRRALARLTPHWSTASAQDQAGSRAPPGAITTGPGRSL